MQRMDKWWSMKIVIAYMRLIDAGIALDEFQWAGLPSDAQGTAATAILVGRISGGQMAASAVFRFFQ
jgi:hypothetical protein